MLALLNAVLTAPGDDTPRMVYADWLDENAGTVPCEDCGGEGEISEKNFHGAWDTWKCVRCRGTGTVSDGKRERAEFIRVQCELAATDDPHGDRYWDGQLGDGPESYRRRKTLRRRERELFIQYAGQWFSDLPGKKIVTPNGTMIGAGHNGIEIEWSYFINRGFVDSITCTAEAWLEGECGRCGGDGDLYYMGGDEESPCPDCSGTGRVPGLADRLYWRAEVECPRCKGQKGRIEPIGGYAEFSGAYPKWEDCYGCRGTGCVRNPDPPPATAQPVTSVVFTTPPPAEFLEVTTHGDGRARKFYHPKFPGVTFGLQG